MQETTRIILLRVFTGCICISLVILAWPWTKEHPEVAKFIFFVATMVYCITFPLRKWDANRNASRTNRRRVRKTRHSSRQEKTRAKFDGNHSV